MHGIDSRVPICQNRNFDFSIAAFVFVCFLFTLKKYYVILSIYFGCLRVNGFSSSFPSILYVCRCCNQSACVWERDFGVCVCVWVKPYASSSSSIVFKCPIPFIKSISNKLKIFGDDFFSCVFKTNINLLKIPVLEPRVLEKKQKENQF